MILGSSGFLGRYIAQEFKGSAQLHSRTETVDSNFDYISEFQSEKDIARLFKENDFKTLINCVALTDIEKCESSPDSAVWLNKTLPGLLAKHSAKNDKKIVHISTDAVFNASKKFSSEDDPKNPQSQYARTKLEGEHLITQEARKSCIFRVNFYGKSPNQKSLLEFFYQNLKSNRPVIGYKDVYFTPLYARDTAKIIRLVSESRNTGVFHVAGKERLSKFEFGKKVAMAMGKEVDSIKPVDFSDSPLLVNRTRELSLDTNKVRTLGYTIPSLDSGIRLAIAELRNE